VFRSTGLFFLTAAVMALLGGLVQINPVWAYGPFVPYLVSSPAQPDWYFGWLDGALRIFPAFEPTILGVTIPASFLPGVVIPGFLFTLIALWPLIEPRLTGDRERHHVLQRPWEAPLRTAVGVAVLTFFGLLTIAGGNDVLASMFQMPVEGLTIALRFAVLVFPLVAGVVAYVLCRNTARRAAAEAAERAAAAAEQRVERPVVVLRRTPSGGFEEVVDEP
jgi:ubiquinol-cytochrome c reductase cytochrome b subunit